MHGCSQCGFKPLTSLRRRFIMVFDGDFVIEDIQDETIREIYYTSIRGNINNFDDCEELTEEEIIEFCKFTGIRMVESAQQSGDGNSGSE
jgi:hypothetical protein